MTTTCFLVTHATVAGVILVFALLALCQGEFEICLNSVSIAIFWPLWVIRGIWWVLSESWNRFISSWKKFGQ